MSATMLGIYHCFSTVLVGVVLLHSQDMQSSLLYMQYGCMQCINDDERFQVRDNDCGVWRFEKSENIAGTNK